ncbi:MAG: 23S rRNA (adenine2503-C2)-methyltransferase [Myxococcota bacterium]|jgi:23S rRNA (adenine2503-C2)-methyltransferase
MISLLAHTPEALAAAIDATPAEARRVLAHLISGGNDSLEGMKRPVSRVVRQRIKSAFHWNRPTVVERVPDATDGSVRYLLRYADGSVAEAVAIPLHKQGAFTVCLSSQVGCAMQCDFCATGRLGLKRHLTAGEIVASWMVVRDEAPGRVTGAVFMGQGEPLHNYDAVIGAAATLCRPCGGRIAAKAITISTVGLVPKIRRFADEGHPYRLIVSLTSAVQSRRATLVPVAARWDVAEVAAALRHYHAASGRRITVAWVLMGGVNHDAAEIEALRELLHGIPWQLNVIDVNDARYGGYRRVTAAEEDAFFRGLRSLDVPFIRRFSVGSNKHSACGMLAARSGA